MKRQFALILAALMLGLSLSACAGEPADVQTTTAETRAPEAPVGDTTALSEETSADPLAADLRFDGETIRFLSRDRDWCDDEITVDEMNGEVVNDAVYKREQAVETRLGVTFDNFKTGGNDELALSETVKTTVLAQSDEYDVISNAVYAVIPLATQNIFLNLYDIPHLDLDNEWWSQGFNSEMSIGNGQYFMAGDATLSLKRFTFVTAFNKQTFADYGIDDIYQTVRDRKWTIEYQTTLAAQMYEDLNGNNVSDDQDAFGFACARYNISSDPYWSSFELPILTKDEDNFYVYSVNVERLDKAVNAINKLWWECEGTLLYPFKSGDLEQDQLAAKFATGNLAMMTIRLINLENTEVRNMADKYGILPIPLLEETQQNYYSMAHDQFCVLGIPLTVPADRYAAIGATLEYFGYQSRELVTPAYYEIALKTKYANDMESGEMLDIIFENLKIDAGVLYSEDLKMSVGPHHNLRNLVGSNKNSTAAVYKMVEKMTPKLLDKLQNAIRDNQH